MKLIVAGSTGFVATEVIRQALSHPAVTSIVALARRETPMSLPTSSSTKAEKLKPVVCNDFGNYPESVKRELAGADACIWYIYKIKPQFPSPASISITYQSTRFPGCIKKL